MLYVSRESAALGAVALCLSLAAVAADETASTQELQEVTITGSRIAVPINVTSTSPIQVISSQDVQLSGKTDSIDIINALPQNIINANVDLGNSNNPLSTPGGVATADLRGLGPQRTLVLVDGRRLGAGDPNTGNPNPAPDLDQIPSALVERVEVVTGGASAVYGSDAIAGVVNFIMKKNFEGVQVDGQYGFYQHKNSNTKLQGLQADLGFAPPTGSESGGGKRDLSIVLGSGIAEGKGNVTGYFTYHNQSPVLGATRDFYNCEAQPNATFDDFTCIGSSNSNRFQLVANQTRNAAGVFVRTPATGAIRLTVVGSQFLAWPQAKSSPPSQFNSNAYEYLQRGNERYNAGFMAHVDVNDWFKPYLEVSFMNDKTSFVVGPSALFTSSNTFAPPGLAVNTNYFVNCSNPLLSAQQRALLCTPAQVAADTASPGSAQAELVIGRRNIEGGGRLGYFEHTNYRAVGGFQGTFSDAWNYDAYGQLYYTTLYNSNENYLNYASITNALQVTGTAANPVCISGSTCVPYNIFTTGGVTPAQLAYLYTPGTAYGQNWEQVVHGDITGDLGQYGVKAPWARDGLAVNVGVERRFEALKFAPDGSELAGTLAGFSGASAAIDQGYSVKEAFTELRAPLIQNLRGAYDLTLDAGYRYSDYTTAGKTNTYKLELQYAPVESTRIRYSFERAIRAPNLIELYNPQTYGQQSDQGVDPCAPTVTAGGVIVPATATLAQCLRTGVTAAQYGNGGTTNTITQCVSGQCGQIIGGNPNLTPETADTYSLGVTFSPSDTGFSGSLDYFHIALSDQVGSIPPSFLFNQCLQNGDPTSCSQIVRTPLGALTGASVTSGGYIVQTNVNTGEALFSGVDVQVGYKLPFGGRAGGFTVNLNGSYIEHTTTTPYKGAHTYDCAGLFGQNCGRTVNPRWRHALRLNWETPWDKLLISAQWRFIGKTGFDNNDADQSLHFAEKGEYDPLQARVPNYNYLDLSAIWAVGHGIELRGGLNNITDKDPPLIGDDITGTGSPNTYPTYDLLGRELFIGIRAKF
jgi:iron complex outermembrane receptor protein